MAAEARRQRNRIARGTGDVFADLGFLDAAERRAKLRLAYALNGLLYGRRLSNPALTSNDDLLLMNQLEACRSGQRWPLSVLENGAAFDAADDGPCDRVSCRRA